MSLTERVTGFLIGGPPRGEALARKWRKEREQKSEAARRLFEEQHAYEALEQAANRLSDAGEEKVLIAQAEEVIPGGGIVLEMSLYFAVDRRKGQNGVFAKGVAVSTTDEEFQGVKLTVPGNKWINISEVSTEEGPRETQMAYRDHLAHGGKRVETMTLPEQVGLAVKLAHPKQELGLNRRKIIYG